MKPCLQALFNKLNNCLTFELEPIVDTQVMRIKDYELLLRSKETQAFPASLFELITSQENANQIFLEWLLDNLIVQLQTDSKQMISINLDPLQLKYPSTLQSLKKVLPYKNRLIIELTEQVPKTPFCQTNDLLPNLKILHEQGFKLALDDLGSGENNLQFLLNNIVYFKRIKLSLLKFRHLDQRSLAALLDFWSIFAQQHHLELVIEGIDSAQKSKFANNKQIYLQQGFRWKAVSGLFPAHN